MWKSRKKFCFSSGVAVCVTAQMSDALQRLTNAALFYWLLLTKAQGPPKLLGWAPKAVADQTPWLRVFLSPGCSRIPMANPSLLLGSTNPCPALPCLPGFTSVLLSRNDWRFQLSDLLASCASSGDFSRKLSLLQSWEEQPQAEVWDGAGSKGCQTGTSSREKFLFLFSSFQVGTDTAWDRARHVSGWHHAKHLHANVSNLTKLSLSLTSRVQMFGSSWSFPQVFTSLPRAAAICILHWISPVLCPLLWKMSQFCSCGKWEAREKWQLLWSSFK